MIKLVRIKIEPLIVLVALFINASTVNASTVVVTVVVGGEAIREPNAKKGIVGVVVTVRGVRPSFATVCVTVYEGRVALKSTA